MSSSDPYDIIVQPEEPTEPPDLGDPIMVYRDGQLRVTVTNTVVDVQDGESQTVIVRGQGNGDS